jgi:hypothetical protein
MPERGAPLPAVDMLESDWPAVARIQFEQIEYLLEQAYATEGIEQQVTLVAVRKLAPETGTVCARLQ